MRAGAILLQLSVQPLQIIVQVTALHWYGLHGVTSSDMLHLTLNTGHVCRSPRSKVRVGMVEKLRPFCRPGRHVLPDHRDWTMQLAGGLAGGLFFTVFDAVQPAVSCGVAGNDGAADEIWPVLKGFYLDLTEKTPICEADWRLPQRPTATPWCARVVIVPDAIYETLDWLLDFERGIAWTWLETRRAVQTY